VYIIVFQRQNTTRETKILSGESVKFPPAEDAREDGLLAWSREINSAMLAEAYRSGIFPWPFEEETVLWFAPPQRAVIETGKPNISRRSLRAMRAKNFSLTVSRDFKAVMEGCAKVPRRDEGTWITRKLIRAYTAFHKEGFAASYETRSPAGELVGGLYGVRIGCYFSAESMFQLDSEASKFALMKAFELLSSEGVSWVDIQVINPFTKSLGGTEVPRERFMSMLRDAVA
jgi:leucyl/phenylalanyl-tRNA--protein transferase